MSWSYEIETQAPAASLFNAFVLDWHNLAPKLFPDTVVVLEGDGGVGTVRRISFASASAQPSSFFKERFDFIDHENFESKHSLIEGVGLGTQLESSSYGYKFEPTSNGGSVVKVVGTYKTMPGVQVTDHEKEQWKEFVIGDIKAADAYVVANPGAYA